MTIGPVHLVVIAGLENEQLRGQIRHELARATAAGAISVLDALAVQKTADGAIVTLGGSDLTPEQREEYGAIIGGLLGFGATGTEEGLEAGAELGAEYFATRNFGLSAEDIREIAADIRPGKTVLMVLFEHRWAVPLKEAIEQAGGMVMAQGIVRPEDLVLMGARLAAETPAAGQVEPGPEAQAH
jgi:uncharacterized membrane protein